MTPEEIAGTLTELFSAEVVKSIAPGYWQIETADFRLLVLLSDDNTWLRVLLPIMPCFCLEIASSVVILCAEIIQRSR